MDVPVPFLLYPISYRSPSPFLLLPPPGALHHSDNVACAAALAGMSPFTYATEIESHTRKYLPPPLPTPPIAPPPPPESHSHEQHSLNTQGHTHSDSHSIRLHSSVFPTRSSFSRPPHGSGAPLLSLDVLLSSCHTINACHLTTPPIPPSPSTLSPTFPSHPETAPTDPGFRRHRAIKVPSTPCTWGSRARQFPPGPPVLSKGKGSNSPEKVLSNQATTSWFSQARREQVL